MSQVSLYRSISAAEFSSERRVPLSPDYFEDAKGRVEWKIRDVLPLDAERYCAFVTPWKAYSETPSGWVPLRNEPFEALPEAYATAGLPTPARLTFESWQSAFRIVEQAKIFPGVFRAVLDRYSAEAPWVFVRCHHGQVHNWRIERALFLELEDPFVEMPVPFGVFTIFPQGVRWFIHTRDEVPWIYLAGERSLVETLEKDLQGRVIDLGLDDRYY